MIRDVDFHVRLISRSFRKNVKKTDRIAARELERPFLCSLSIGSCLPLWRMSLNGLLNMFFPFFVQEPWCCLTFRPTQFRVQWSSTIYTTKSSMTSKKLKSDLCTLGKSYTRITNGAHLTRVTHTQNTRKQRWWIKPITWIKKALQGAQDEPHRCEQIDLNLLTLPLHDYLFYYSIV